MTARGGTGQGGADDGRGYDCAARRETSLASKLKERLRRGETITVGGYMEACLLDPEFGYYRTRAAIGRSGDFITAPEISQVFGELIGLWAAVVWQQMGEPHRVRLIEVGPGRGTLMRDALRAVQRVPAFKAALSVELVEPNPLLCALQRDVLAGAGVAVSFRQEPFVAADAAGGPAILIANEYLDCLSVEHAVTLRDPTTGETVRGLRTIALGIDDRLEFGVVGMGTDSTAGIPCVHPNAESAGTGFVALAPIREYRDLRPLFDGLWRAHLGHPFAGLFIDYGYAESGTGETLQAVRNHRYEDALTSPGEADLTAEVDFDDLRRTASGAGFGVDGPVTQGEFLGALGIIERASRLMAANPAMASQIEVDIARLMAPGGMGTRFKALGIRSPDLPPLPGFPTSCS